MKFSSPGELSRVLSHSQSFRIQKRSYILKKSAVSMNLNPTEERTTELLESLAEVRTKIQAASIPERPPTLVAVSKVKPASDIIACVRNGQLDFGENYVQELEEKARVLPADIRWHFIGTFQSNKAKILASIPNLYSVQTLGSIKAATGLQKALPADRASPLRVFVQINTSGEDSKSGLPPLTPVSNIDNSDVALLAKYILSDCSSLKLEGLMTIGALELSLTASETEKNADFERLKETRDLLHSYLEQHFGKAGEKWGDKVTGRLLLSMGMSSDYEAALKAGSDIVRVGTGIFGQRPKKTA